MKTQTIVSFILDKSGSMGIVRDATISGFNEYLTTLKNDAMTDYNFSLTLFDTDVIKKESVPIASVPALTSETYIPAGNTALYDAVCSTIKQIPNDTDKKVIVIIMTDGEENASREYTQVHMRDLIKEREAKGNWKFVYLGANQDSYASAQKFGISAMNASNFNTTAGGMKATMRGVAQNTMFYSASATNNTQDFFSQKDQNNYNDAK